jgi:hypothetical protein
VDDLNNKLDKVLDKVSALEVISARQEANLGEHMRRTDLLEKMYTKLDDKVESKIEPIEATVNRIVGGFKFVALYIIPLVAAVVATLHFLQH